MVRLQKLLADAGLASRRSCEQLIVAGRVEVNGSRVSELGTKVDPARDAVTVDGARVKPRRKLYVALNKPRGYLCSRTDPLKRRCAGALLPREWKSLYSVGRLDHDSEGLLFFTNDGEFCLRLTHPRYGIRKKYRVTVEGRLDAPPLKQLIKGVSSEGELLKAEKAWLVNSGASRSIAELELIEGKNREVRRMLGVLGFNVVRLQRIQIGRIKLGELPSGKWRTLSGAEVASLLSIATPNPQPHEH